MEWHVNIFVAVMELARQLLTCALHCDVSSVHVNTEIKPKQNNPSDRWKVVTYSMRHASSECIQPCLGYMHVPLRVWMYKCRQYIWIQAVG
jgi:hypothetical protein